jgi:hypothetical protein
MTDLFRRHPQQLRIEGIDEAMGVDSENFSAGDAFGRLICFVLAEGFLTLSKTSAETGSTWRGRNQYELYANAMTCVRLGEAGLEG